MTTVNDIPEIEFDPTISFTTAPQGNQYTYVAGGTIYTPTGAYYTLTDTTITFTATVAFTDPGRQVIEYHWDFGDGVNGWGNPATHIYKGNSKHAQAVLRVTDDRGRQYYARKQMYIVLNANEPLTDEISLLL